MEARAQAGIELHGATLRYAEVESYGPQRPDRSANPEGDPGGHRLLRLGSCEFDFDAANALWAVGDSEGSEATDRRVATLGEALADVYESTAAEELCVAVHPAKVHSFFAPVPAQMPESDRRARFRREARLLRGTGVPAAAEGAATGEESPGGEDPLLAGDGPREDDLHLETRALHSEEGSESRQWFHVLALDGAVHARFRRLMERLPIPGVRWTTSTEAAARAAGALQRGRAGESDEDEAASAEAPFTLAVGRYSGHLELVLVRGGRLFHALHAPGAAPADAAYFTAALLDRLEIAPSAVGQVFTYGLGTDAPADDLGALDRLIGAAPELLDVRPVVGLDSDRLAEDFEASSYVPCVGAAL